MAIWTPNLTGRTGPRYSQIIAAIADDISSGILRPGTRLPPHRLLAYALGVSPNTTSRAYAEGVRRGLLRGEVGRGTYVRSPQGGLSAGKSADLRRPSDGPIDFSHNLPFAGAAANHLAQTLSELGGTPGLQTFLDYQTETGLSHHLAAGATWLRQTEIIAPKEEIVISCGAQHGILAALLALTCPGDVLLTEEFTYSPIRTMAEHLGLKLCPVAMDSDGLSPDALEEACQRRAVKILYLTPTIQTPTTATMSEARRAAIAAIARKHQLLIIEDDVYAPLKASPRLPIACLVPQHTIYISSTSKCLSPGLRVAFLHAPPGLVAALRHAVTISCWMPPPLMVEIAARWIFDGTANALTEAQRKEAVARQELARTILAGHDMQADPEGFHVWLPLPTGWYPDRFCAEAAQQGVRLIEGAAFAADDRLKPNAVRISLSHEPARDRVITGLKILAKLLKAPVSNPPLIM